MKVPWLALILAAIAGLLPGGSVATDPRDSRIRIDAAAIRAGVAAQGATRAARLFPGATNALPEAEFRAAQARGRVAEARPPARSVPPGPGARLLLPVQGRKTSDFGMRYDPFYHVWQLHAGVDIAAGGGQPIYAADDGRVTRAGWYGGYGKYTCLDHGPAPGGSLTTCYGHQSRILVGVNQRVRRGQLIGRVGRTGAATGYHLHFEVRVGGEPVNPLSWLPGCR